MPQRLQTELIQSIALFKEFEKSFEHFFEECERGFINEVIVNLFVRTEKPGKVLVGYMGKFSELCFIRKGAVEVYNNNNDCVVSDRPILYMPKYAYFGDQQILFKIKSNLIYKAMEYREQDARKADIDST